MGDVIDYIFIRLIFNLLLVVMHNFHRPFSYHMKISRNSNEGFNLFQLHNTCISLNLRPVKRVYYCWKRIHICPFTIQHRNKLTFDQLEQVELHIDIT